MMRVPFLIGATANTPRPWIGELRASISGEVAITGCDLARFFLRAGASDFLRRDFGMRFSDLAGGGSPAIAAMRTWVHRRVTRRWVL